MEANYFTIFWWFLPYIHMNQPQVYMCSPSWLSFPPPSPSHLSGLSQWTQALSALFHASNLDWSSVSHMVIYMLQCYSLISSHSRLLPQSPKACSLHLCLFCCLAYRATVTIFQISYIFIQFSSVQSLSHVRLFATPWIAAHQASLSITNSWSLLKLTSIESVMPSSHLILCHPLLLLPPIPPSIRIFCKQSTLRMRWPKYWSFSIFPSKEHAGLISFRMDWLDLLAVQGTLKSLLQHHSSKASIQKVKILTSYSSKGRL